jgi:uncharacterized protein
LVLHNLVGTAIIGRTPQGLVVQGRFSAETTLECVRCLKEFVQPLTFEFTELYAFQKKDMSESELLVPDDAHIDLAVLIREYALLEIPIRPLHDPECKGLCIECGQDLNIKDCGHDQGGEESPFAPLKDLLK